MSIVNPHLEKIFFHNILKHREYVDTTNPRFFEEPLVKRLFPLTQEFWNRYKECPTLSQVREVIKVKGLDQEISNSQLETLWNVNLGEYDDEWLKENTETFIEYKTLEASAIDLSTYLQTTNVTTENIKNVIEKSRNMILDRNNINFEFSEGSDFFNPASHRQPTYNTFSTGYNFLDTVLDGGFASKTLNVLLGQAKIGKSIWLANLAAMGIKAGHNVAVITMEMAEHIYTKRLGSNLLNIPVKDYKNVAEDQEMIKRKISELGFDTLQLPGQLLIKEFPTSTASSLDIEAYLRKVEERRKIKFKMVIIDYINIMKNWRNPNTENTYMKIKQIAEDVRAMAQANNWAVISATQVKQTFFDSSDMTIGAAAESSGLVATVDSMFGIIQTPEMYINNKYTLKVLANRAEGFKNYFKNFDIKYEYMRITEDAEPMKDGDAILQHLKKPKPNYTPYAK